MNRGKLIGAVGLGLLSATLGAEAQQARTRAVERFHGARRRSVHVDKILRGASPAILPVESSQYELVINP